MTKRRTPSFAGLRAATVNARRAAQGASKKNSTGPEVLLRRALWASGIRYRVNAKSIPGKPDIVIARLRVAIFCDGDFWHGRDLEVRLAKLGVGHNPTYWVKKIQTNVERDRRVTAELQSRGWFVIRVWEGDIQRRLSETVASIEAAIRAYVGAAAAKKTLREASDERVNAWLSLSNASNRTASTP